MTLMKISQKIIIYQKYMCYVISVVTKPMQTWYGICIYFYWINCVCGTFPSFSCMLVHPLKHMTYDIRSACFTYCWCVGLLIALVLLRRSHDSLTISVINNEYLSVLAWGPVCEKFFVEIQLKLSSYEIPFHPIPFCNYPKHTAM